MKKEDPFAPLLEGLKAAGITNAEIVHHSGIARATLWRLSNGVIESPSLNTYMTLGKFYERAIGQPPPPLKFR